MTDIATDLRAYAKDWRDRAASAELPARAAEIIDRLERALANLVDASDHFYGQRNTPQERRAWNDAVQLLKELRADRVPEQETRGPRHDKAAAETYERMAVCAGTLTGVFRAAHKILDKHEHWRVDGMPERYKAPEGRAGYWWRVWLARPKSENADASHADNGAGKRGVVT